MSLFSKDGFNWLNVTVKILFLFITKSGKNMVSTKILFETNKVLTVFWSNKCILEQETSFKNLLLTPTFWTVVYMFDLIKIRVQTLSPADQIWKPNQKHVQWTYCTLFLYHMYLFGSLNLCVYSTAFTQNWQLIIGGGVIIKTKHAG